MRDSRRPFRYLVMGWLVVVTVITAIALLRPSPVLSDVDLTQAVNSAFLPRAEDPALHDLAHLRALEASVNFAHTGCCAEVLAWNSGFPDPVGTVISQWMGSPAHAALLSDPSFTSIGCGAVTTSDGRFVAACVLAVGTPQPPPAVVPAPASPVPLSTGAPPPVELPNTAIMETP